MPYENKNQAQILRNMDRGIREPIPEDAPLKFGILISRCWSQRAEDRPDMHDVAREMREFTGSIPVSDKVTSSPKPAAVDSGYAAFSRK